MRYSCECKTSRRRFTGNICDIELDNIFLDMTPIIQSIKENINNLNFIQIGTFCSYKLTVKIKRLATEWNKLFAKHISDK